MLHQTCLSDTVQKMSLCSYALTSHLLFRQNTKPLGVTENIFYHHIEVHENSCAFLSSYSPLITRFKQNCNIDLLDVGSVAMYFCVWARAVQFGGTWALKVIGSRCRFTSSGENAEIWFLGATMFWLTAIERHFRKFSSLRARAQSRCT